MAEAINQRIEGTDIYVFSRGDEESYTFFRPFELDEAKQLADATNRLIADYDVKGLNGRGLEVDEGRTEIFNISTLRGILANRTLMQQTDGQSWFPTIGEGVKLQRAGLYRDGILIDHGLALYSEENPDAEIAASLVADAQRLSLALPALVSFNSLDLEQGGTRYGITPKLVSKKGVISGKEAERVLGESFRWVGNSGVLGLGRYGGGWGASWGGVLGSFGTGCRVGRFIAVGDAQKLQEEALGSFSPIKRSLDNLLSSVQ